MFPNRTHNDTYMLQHNLVFRSVIIHNRSNVVVHYEWKAFATEEDEQTEKEMY